MTRQKWFLGVFGLVGLLAVGWLIASRDGSPEVRAPAEARTAKPGVSSPPTISESEARGESASGRAVVTGGASQVLGTVSAPNGDPIRGAVIRVYGLGNWREQEPLGSASSDATGHFRILTSADWTGPFLVHVQANGFQGMSTNPVHPDKPVGLTLDWVTEVFGRVSDRQSGEPIAGASVRGGGGSPTLTGSDGYYRLTGVVVGRDVILDARKDGYVWGGERVLIKEPRPTEVDIALQRGTRISVQAFDRETGDPVQGARVLLREEEQATSDSEGRFRLFVAEGMFLSVRIEAEGYAPLTWGWEVKDAEPPSLRIPLARLAFIEGRVTDEEGQPVSGVSVDDRSEHGSHRGLTGAERQGLPGLVSYEYYRRGHGRAAGDPGAGHGIAMVDRRPTLERRSATLR